PAGGLRVNPVKPQIVQIELLDKDIDHANWVVFANPIVQAFGKQRALPTVHALDKPLHPIPPQIARGIITSESLRQPNCPHFYTTKTQSGRDAPLVRRSNKLGSTTLDCRRP